MRVNRMELAEILGRSMPTVTAWLEDGMPCVEGGGKGKPFVFDPAECIEWAVENGKFRPKRRQPEPDVREGVESYEEAERRKMVAAADKAELELARAAGRVVLIEDVASSIAELHTNVKARLTGIPEQVRVQARSFFGDDREAEQQIVAAVETVVNHAIADLRDDAFGEGCGEG